MIGKKLELIEMPQLYFGNPILTIGKFYEIIDIEGSNYWIKDDEGHKCSIGKCRFKQTENMKNSKKMHYVIFDGTSAFVGDESDLKKDYEILFKSYDLEKCNNFCDKYNEEVYP